MSMMQKPIQYGCGKGRVTNELTPFSKAFVNVKDHVLSLALHQGIVTSAAFLKCQYKLDDNKQIKNTGNVNRYTFVWKKVIHKNEVKMFEKIKTSIEELNNTFFTNFLVSKDTLISDMDNVLRYLEEKRQKEKIEFVHGIGKRKIQLQRFTEQLKEFKERQ